MPNTVNVIGKNTFKDSKIHSIVIPNSVLTIDDNAFSGCSDLSKVQMGNKVERIGKNAFLNCKILRYIDIPDSVKTIGEGAFKGCESTNNSSGEYDNVLTICCEASTKPSGWDEKWNESDYTVFWRCTTQDGIKYSLRYGSTGSEAVVIVQDEDVQTVAVPSVVYGWALGSSYKVVEIAERAFFNCENLTSVILPDGLTSIGNSAFYGCKSLASIEISVTIEEIGENAFANCNTLQFNEYENGLYLGNKDNPYMVLVKVKSIDMNKLIIHNGTKIILANALEGFNSLSGDVIDGSEYLGNDNNPYLVLIRANKDIKSYNVHSNTYVIVQNAFDDCNDLARIEVDSNNPNYYAQSGILYNKAKTEIIFIPQKLEGDVIIPDGITEVNKECFKNRTAITSIAVPNSVIRIEGGAFYGCSGLTSMVLPFVGECDEVATNSSHNVLGFIFGSTGFVGGKSTTQYWAERSCYTYYIPISLRNITVTRGNISYGAFYNCSNLTNITLKNGITTIGDVAFMGCSSLTDIVLPNSLTSIGEDILSDCDNLRYYTNNGSDYLGNDSNTYLMLMKAYNDSSFEINEKTRFIYPGGFSGRSLLESIIVSNDNPNYASQDGILYNKEKTEFIFVPPAIKRTVIPNTITNIDGAFTGRKNIESISIPNSITSIGAYTFSGCSKLVDIEIPKSVTRVGNYAFSDCSSLTNIVIPNSVTDVGTAVFYNCTSLSVVVLSNKLKALPAYNSGGGTINGFFENCKSLVNIKIPNGVTCIEFSTFENCKSLTSIVLPNNVTSIESYAFQGCDRLENITLSSKLTSVGYQTFLGCSSLTSIKFNGTKSQWNAIGKESRWNGGTGNYTVTCTDGTLSKSES